MAKMATSTFDRRCWRSLGRVWERRFRCWCFLFVVRTFFVGIEAHWRSISRALTCTVLLPPFTPIRHLLGWVLSKLEFGQETTYFMTVFMQKFVALEIVGINLKNCLLAICQPFLFCCFFCVVAFDFSKLMSHSTTFFPKFWLEKADDNTVNIHEYKSLSVHFHSRLLLSECGVFCMTTRRRCLSWYDTMRGPVSDKNNKTSKQK